MAIRVYVCPHNPEWLIGFEHESASIIQTLDPLVVAIHHIGSTAIPHIYAKPIIDILVEVEEIAQLDQQRAAMEALGYEALGEFGIPGRRYFRKDTKLGLRTHHVHGFGVGSPEVERHLAFRDYMMAHPDEAQRYSDLKRQLVKTLQPDDIDGYMDGKDSFIKEMERRALEWRSR